MKLIITAIRAVCRLFHFTKRKNARNAETDGDAIKIAPLVERDVPSAERERKVDPKRKGSPCYYCGDPSVSLEHIPPQQIFAGFDCGEITVPSCKDHNEAKSFFDECVVKGFLYALQCMIEDKTLKVDEVHPSVLKAMERVRHRFPQIKRLVRKTPMFRPGEDPLNRGLSAVSSDGRLDFQSWIKKVTAGLIWDAVKEYQPALDWVEQAVVLDNFYVNAEDPSMGLKFSEILEFNRVAGKSTVDLESCKWIDGWSAWPKPYPSELYWFKLGYSPAGNLWFYHCFFSKFKFFVAVKCPQELALKIAIHCDARELISTFLREGLLTRKVDANIKPSDKD